MLIEGGMPGFDKLRPIAGGLESSVYRVEDQVVKRYYKGVPLSVVENYREITNRAVDLLNGNPFQSTVYPEGDYGRLCKVHYQVVPIDWVNVDSDGRVITASRYIVRRIPANKLLFKHSLL